MPWLNYSRSNRSRRFSRSNRLDQAENSGAL
jgi:hypothetical protein